MANFLTGRSLVDARDPELDVIEVTSFHGVDRMRLWQTRI
jgi:hypothetical protein